MLAFDIGLSENECIVGMNCAISDPVLLGKDRGTVDYELCSGGIVCSSSLHLHSVVAIP